MKVGPTIKPAPRESKKEGKLNHSNNKEDSGICQTKKCKYCFKEKGLEEFHKFRWECKECVKIRIRKWKKNNVDKVRKYQEDWRRSNHEVVKSYEPIFKKEHPDYFKEWYERNPNAYRSGQIVYCAIKNGTIKKPVICEMCKQKKRIIGHHEDYNFPLEITWLCDSCHKNIHIEKRRNENEQN